MSNLATSISRLLVANQDEIYDALKVVEFAAGLPGRTLDDVDLPDTDRHVLNRIRKRQQAEREFGP